MSIAERVRGDELFAARATEMKRVLIASIIGTAVEWYDFLIYATASALVFTKLFFPSSNYGLSAIASFGTLGVGYFARPLGAAIFGHFGDRFGRKAMLATTIVIMGLGTFLVGLLPTYQQIGFAAPVLLVLLRLFQGVGLGGEWGGAVLIVVENAESHNRGLLGSMVQLGYPLGTLSAVGIFALLSRVSEADFLGWAWRIPFLISIFLAGVGLYIRLQLQETPVFRELQAENKVAKLPVVEVLTKEPRAFFTAVGLKLSEISYALIAGVFAINYVTVKTRHAAQRYPRRGLRLLRCRSGGDPVIWLALRPDRPQGDVLCWRSVRDGFRVPVLLAVGHEGPDHHHTDDCRRHHLRADDRLRRRRAMVHGTFCGPDTLQRRFARLPDRRRHQWGSHAICGGDLLVMDERRHVANLDIPDRARRRHALRNDRRP